MSGVSTFTQELADAICERLADGESLRAICADEAMPARATVFKWLADNPAFSDQYAHARAEQADAIFDDILDIADDGSNDWMERKDADEQNIGWRENGEALRRSALRVDARKWVLAKLAPKKYGDKATLALTGEGGGPVEMVHTTDRDRAKAAAAILARGLTKAKADGGN